jgi:hypothetical protein
VKLSSRIVERPQRTRIAAGPRVEVDFMMRNARGCVEGCKQALTEICGLREDHVVARELKRRQKASQVPVYGESPLQE